MDTPTSFTSGHLLARNVIFNLIGLGAPLLVAIFSIPFLIRGMGTDRFGILTLAWIVIGYFNLFDLGLGLGLTKFVAERLGTKQEKDIPSLVWTAQLLILSLGLFAMIVVSLLSPWLVQTALKVPKAIQQETLTSFYILALSIPIVISTAGLRGVLEAQQRFGQINAMRILMGIFTFIGPLMVLPFSQSLVPIVTVLLAGRALAWFLHLIFCIQVMPKKLFKLTFDYQLIRPLIRFGGWITVSNVVGPLMVYLDRFLIGSLVSMTAVAYYTTPYELVTKLWLIPGSIAGVLFPAFSTCFAQDRSRTTMLFGRGVKYVFLIMFPLILFIVTLGYECLDFWLGVEFAMNSAYVLQWLAVGVFINSLAQIHFFLIQGVGRSDLAAKIHLIELPVYLFGAWWLIGSHGIKGAAIAWLARVAVDALMLFGVAQRLLQFNARVIRQMTLTMIVALLSLALATTLMDIGVKLLYIVISLLGFGFVSWFRIMTPEERDLVRNPFKFVNVSG